MIRRLLLSATAMVALGCPPPQPPPLPPKPTPEQPQPRTDCEAEAQTETKSSWAPPTVRTWELGNGASVWHLRRPQIPLISLSLTFPHGSASDPPDKAGLTGLTADMLDEGAGELSALDLSEALQRLATDYGSSPDVDGTTLSMNMLSDTLDDSLALLSDIVMRPHLAESELQRRRGLWSARAISRESNPGDTRTIVMRRILFGDGYGGWPGYGTKTSLAKIGIADIKAQYKAVFQPGGATFVVVGDVTRETIDAALNKAFGAWTGTASARAAKLTQNAMPLKAMYTVDYPKSTQSSIAVLRRAEGAHAKDYFPAMVFNWSLGGSFSSRLNLNLREDKGYTYGARAHLWRWRETGLYALAAQVKRETTIDSLNEMVKELEAMSGSKRLTTQEHGEAIGGLLLGFPGRFERLGGVASQLTRLTRLGHNANWLSEWPAKVQGVSHCDALDSGVSHTQGHFAMVVAGDMSVIGKELEALGRPMYDCTPEGQCEARK